MIAAVARDKAKDPKNYSKKANAKLLKATATIAFDRIPSDPTSDRYRLGETLGPDNKHWFRDKFGNGRFRLFFRYDTRSKVIIYAWVNDDTNLREYDSKTDAYAVFAKMLENGNPPNSWADLLASCPKTDELSPLLKEKG